MNEKATYFGSLRAKTHFSTSWHAKMSYDSQGTNIECSLYKNPHYLQACTVNLPDIEGCMQNNQILTTSHVELDDHSNASEQKRSLF